MHTLYGYPHPTTTTIDYNESIEGEPIEKRVERILSQNEPITDGAPIIYTKRSDGVRPEYNIRTDRWDLALDMASEITRQGLARRTEYHTKQNEKPPTGEPQSSPGPQPGA